VVFYTEGDIRDGVISLRGVTDTTRAWCYLAWVAGRHSLLHYSAVGTARFRSGRL